MIRFGRDCNLIDLFIPFALLCSQFSELNNRQNQFMGNKIESISLNEYHRRIVFEPENRTGAPELINLIFRFIIIIMMK